MNKIIDCHCHIYPDKIASKAIESIGKFYSIPMNKSGTLGDMVQSGAAAGITHYVVFSVATTAHQVASINTFISQTVNEHKGLMTGLGTLHADSQDMEADVEHLVSLGLKGVKLHPDITGVAIDDPRCMKMYEICEGRLPFLIHTGDYRYDYSNPDRVKRVLEAFPKLQMIGAHFGGWSVYEQAASELNKYQNFTVDCSSALYAISKQTARDIIRTYGAHRVLFGTDYPMWDQAEEIKKLLDLELTDEENQMIFHRNAEALFGIQ